MKLTHYTIRNLSVPLLLIMTAWAAVFFFLVLHEVNDETNDTLQNYKEIIIKQVLADKSLIKDHKDIMTSYQIREIPGEKANLAKDEFYDSTKYIEIEKEYEPIRGLLTCFMGPDGKYYELRIEMSTLEKEDLLETVLWSIIILYILLLCCILLVTHSVFRKSFRPLYNVLNWLNRYHPGKKIEPLENETVIEEFDTLNRAFREATLRGVAVYEQQRQFVENASHELQTPLAVSVNKLELLSENPDCTEEQLSDIAGIHRTLQGIIKMNRSLLLLSRIDNNQFPETKEVSLTAILKRILSEFAELYRSKNIHVYIIREEELTGTMNESLAHTLIQNLVKNAYIHNSAGGEVYIEVTQDSLMIENTSESPELNQERLFQRFGRQSNRPDSSGLGLAIVKSISDLYGIEISYSYYGKHRFVLTMG